MSRPSEARGQRRPPGSRLSEARHQERDEDTRIMCDEKDKNEIYRHSFEAVPDDLFGQNWNVQSMEAIRNLSLILLGCKPSYPS